MAYGYFSSTLKTRDTSQDEPSLTEVHIDFIMYLLETKQVSPMLTRTAEIVITERCAAHVAEELIVILKGLRDIGVPRKTVADIRADRQAAQTQAAKDHTDKERAAAIAALEARGVHFK